MTEAEEVLKEAELITEAITSLQGGFTEFEGVNCNDYLEDDQEPCQGWNGTDHRCQCGNRKVGWTVSEDYTYVYPEAY